jgi:hypothetical protein
MLTGVALVAASSGGQTTWRKTGTNCRRRPPSRDSNRIVWLADRHLAFCDVSSSKRMLIWGALATVDQ